MSVNLVCYDVSSQFGPCGTTRHIILPNGMPIALVSANGQVVEGADPKKTHAVGHWQVTDYSTAYNDYEIVICFWLERRQVVILRTLPAGAKNSACWKRNTAALNWAFAGYAGAVPTSDLRHIAKPGSFPATDEMVEGASIVLAEYGCWHEWDLEGTVNLPVWRCNADESDMTMLTTDGLIAPVLADHAFFARADGYSDARWDIAELNARVNSFAVGHKKSLKTGIVQFQCLNIIKAA
jgi:hypothetical protein